MDLKAFLCHDSHDSPFVVQVAMHLKRNLDEVFYFEAYQRPIEHFAATIEHELATCNVFVIFVGETFTVWQGTETHAALTLHNAGDPKNFFVVLLQKPNGENYTFPPDHPMLRGFQAITAESTDASGASKIASRITLALGRPWLSEDDLALDPHLFSYEKDIIHFFNRLNRLGPSVFEEPGPKGPDSYEAMREKLLKGCPPAWPTVTRWRRNPPLGNRLDPKDVGNWRSESASVLTEALLNVSDAPGSQGALPSPRPLTFPEAGPRSSLYFPRPRCKMRIAILVSGGIAPGINAVIDGIVQRHWLYAMCHGYANHKLKIFGLLNGFRAFDSLPESYCLLIADPSHLAGEPGRLETSHHIHEGGSILGTSRVDDLLVEGKRIGQLRDIVGSLRALEIDILYVIGGDGSMKAAHAIWSIAQAQADARALSVVAIPKTMDNDILWVWQSFGFLSAVEKAREFIEHLSTEVNSNPRVCVAQLFGSDSGFVVSHAVLASATGHCVLALIPEVPFSMRTIAQYLKERICNNGKRIPYGLVVMAETAIPLDAMNYVGAPGEKPLIEIGLTDDEKDAIRKFEVMRSSKERIQGQTNDDLRTAGLKIVKEGLRRLLPDPEIGADLDDETDWDKLRVFTNEPRHLLRAIPPSSSDIIIGHRLGTLAVDNAMAGYTDFMISQWLTEYVLVPLKLVVLGRKRIPQSGIFWKSVLAKTGQPSDLT